MSLVLPEDLSDNAVDGNSASSDENVYENFDGVAAMRTSIRSLFHGNRRKVHARKAPLPLKAKKRRTPSWRIRLKEYWDRRVGVTDSKGPWPVLIVDSDRCMACGICMQLCPTGSINHSLGDEVFTYSFVPGTCVNCGLCIVSCASSALSRDYRSVAHPFDDRECSTRAAKPCTRCGLPALIDQGESQCFLCRSEPDSHTFADRVKTQMKGFTRPDEGGKGKVRM